MKKIIKSRVFAFMLGAIIFGSIVVVSAYTIFAIDIGYTPKDSTWKKSNGEDIENVSDALDELYNRQTKRIDNLNASLTKISDRNAGYWSTDKCTGGTISVSKNSYYIITIFYGTSSTINLDGVNIISEISNGNHVMTHNNVLSTYTIYYVYTTLDTITVTSSQNSYLSYSKMRLFEE